MKTIKFILAVFTIVFGFKTQAQIIVKVKPIVPRHAVVIAPGKAPLGHVWIAGDWVVSGGKYMWKDGHYTKNRPGYRYVEGHWRQNRKGWVWVPGKWRRR